MEVKRSVTNLRVDPRLQLPKQELKKKFLFVFNRGFRGDPFLFTQRLWVGALWPEISNEEAFGKNKKAIQKYLRENDPAHLAPYTRISKEMADEKFFRASIPFYRSALAGSGREIYQRVAALFLGNTPETPFVEDQELVDNLQQQAVMNRFIPSNKILASATWLDSSGKLELSESFLGIRFETRGRSLVVFADFKISLEEAQQLSSTPWLQIRNIDLYPLLLHWVVNAYGYRGRPLVSSFPISAISRTLPGDQARVENLRIDDFGLTITPEGRASYLPRIVDNTQRYEDLYSQAGVNEDNSFSLLDQRKAGQVPKLPVNVPVLVDWQNLKFAYSNTSGALTTLDLARYQKMNASHAMALLGKNFDPKKMLQFVNLAQASSTPLNLSLYLQDKDVQGMNDGKGIHREQIKSGGIESYFMEAVSLYRQMEGQDIVLLSDFTESNPYFAPVARFLAAVYKDCLANLDVVYLKYSVAYTTVLLGTVGMIVNYAKDIEKTKLEDQTIRKAALDQAVTEGWEPPSIPLLSDRVGLLPHQKKVRNLLKDSPDFAILPVQAGGGKSPLIIIDILYEIKANRNQPYLILCPGHLVAQYVKEIVFFTGGKFNAIPINTYVIRTSGYARLGKILEAAPRNTVVVCDYDALRYRVANTIYGTSPTAVYPVIEFLRQFAFGYVALDESHSVKNASSRTRACMTLITDIPKKRLASGTMAHDSASDLAMQIAMLDPTLFGTREEFNAEYGETFSGERVSKWKPGAATAIMEKIKTRVVVAGAMRKEWAALLPQAQEKFIRVDLTPTQLQVYKAVLDDTLDEIREAAKTNKNLLKFLDPSSAKPAVEGEDADGESSESDDEALSEDLESLLKPYLARLEQFITAPARDKLGDKLLQGEDRISPKVRMIAERVRLHIQSGVPGKVLIFTNYTASAEEIFANMPPELQSSGLLYTAAEKIEKGAAFETSPSKLWMVGVENSMNTGLNLQHVSRLIRTECVWNPGTLEQGNSRVNRPELKKADRRESLFFDWIVANQTIDVTKVSRLISKLVSVSKFENAEDGNYQGLPDVEVIQMTLDNVTTFNSWDSNLLSYFEAYKSFKQVQADDYADYRAKHGELVLDPVTIAPTPSDAMLLKRVPYVPGLELYGQADLGLVRVDEYLRLEPDEDEAEGDDKEDKDEEAGDSVNPLAVALVGRHVHTEYGDGIVTHVAKDLRRLKIRLADNIEARTRSAATFLITRQETSTKDIRNQVLKSIGAMPIATPIDVPAAVFKPVKLTIKELRMQEKIKKEKEVLKPTPVTKKEVPKAITAELEFCISNGFLSLAYMGDPEEGTEVAMALEAVGFRPNLPFIYAPVVNAQRLVKQFNVWEAAGFTLDKTMAESLSQAFRSMHQLLKSQAISKHRAVYQFSQASKLRNFYRTEMKPNNDPTVIKPYPMIENGVAYIVLPIRGQTGTKMAIQHKAPGIRWRKSEPSISYYCQDMNKALAVLKSVIAAGIEISNIDDLKKEFNKIKKAQFRSEDDGNSMAV